MSRPTLTTPGHTAAVADRFGDVLLWLGVILTLLPQLLRATSNSTTFPFWDQDPLIYSISAPAFTPADSMLVDAATLLGAAMLLARAIRQRVPTNVSLMALAFIGAVAVVLHGWLVSPTGFSLAWTGNGSLGNQRIGASWLSAIVGAVAVWHAAQDLRVRRIFAGTLLGLIALFACYGIAQVYFIHAQTMADFKADPDKFLAAHGWSRDSSMAKSFVRRISQPEASAWFGLANVYATFAAAGFAAGLVLLLSVLPIPQLRSSKSKGASSSEISNLKFQIPAAPLPLSQTLFLALFTLVCAVALVLASSKGGTLAFVGALAAAVALFILSRRPSSKGIHTLAALVGLAAIIGPILLVLLRGRLGEHALGEERSLLFRSFYAEASVRIFTEHPILGVGPDGFQRAFTIAKPPLCPEEVQSPHCIPLDYLADLGILGLAWVLLLARFAIGAARNVMVSTSDIPHPTPDFSRNDTRLLLALPVLATLLITFLETPYITPDVAVVRIGGLILWCLCAWAISRVIADTLASRLALAAAALAALAHAQIDVVASLPLSAPIWLMLIAVAASPSSPALPTPAGGVAERNKAGGGMSSLRLLPIAITLALSLLIFATSISRTRPWQRHLEDAALTVRPIAEITERLNAITRPPVPGERATDSIEAIARDLRMLTNNPSLQPTPPAINGAVLWMRTALLPRAADSLERAFTIYPDNRLPLREASRLHLQLAQIALDLHRPDQARGHFDRAISVLHILPSTADTIPNPSGPELQWLASILERRAETLSEPESLRRAIELRLRLTAVDPYNLDNALKLFRDYEILSDPGEARRWAAHTLELHDYTRLDRETRGLSPADLTSVQNATKSPPIP